MLRAEVIDTTNKVHSRLQGLALLRQRSRAPGQACKTTAKGPIYALNESGVDRAFALRLFDHLCDGFRRPLIDLTPHADDPIVLILLYHLRDQNLGPFDHPTSPRFISRLFLTENFPDRLWITRQAINAEENRPAERRGAAFDARDQLLNKFAVSRSADFSAQPQAVLDHDRHAHPDDCALEFDPKLIALDLANWPRLLDQMLMHELRVPAAFLKPVPDRPLIQAEGEDNGLDGAAVREQFDHQRDQVSALPQAVEDRPSSGAETLVALVANVAAVFLRMYADVAFSDLSSGRTVEVGTKCGFWGQWRFVFLTRHKEKRRLTSDFFQGAMRPRLNVGLPGKVRPGFIETKSSFRTCLPCPPGAVCALICAPVELSDIDTGFSLDVGGVAELYPSKRVIVRLDVGDTIANRQAPSFFVSQPIFNRQAPLALIGNEVFVVPGPSVTTHNLQLSVGVGFRF